MKRRFKIAWRLYQAEGGELNALGYLFGRYRLADWEEELLLLPKRQGNGTGSL